MILLLRCTTHPLISPRHCLGQCPQEVLKADLRLYFFLHQIKEQRRQAKKKRCVQDKYTLAIISSLSSVMFCGSLWWLVGSTFPSCLPSLKGEKDFSPEYLLSWWYPPITRLSPQRDSGKQLLDSAVRQRLGNRSPPSLPTRRKEGGRRLGTRVGQLYIKKTKTAVLIFWINRGERHCNSLSLRE